MTVLHLVSRPTSVVKPVRLIVAVDDIDRLASFFFTSLITALDRLLLMFPLVAAISKLIRRCGSRAWYLLSFVVVFKMLINTKLQRIVVVQLRL